MILEIYRIEHRATELGIVRTKAHAAMRDEQSRAAMDSVDPRVQRDGRARSQRSTRAQSPS